jgi:hypothetical protein
MRQSTDAAIKEHLLGYRGDPRAPRAELVWTGILSEGHVS